MRPRLSSIAGLTLAAGLALSLPATSFAQESGGVVGHPDQGFEVARPGADWAIREAKGALGSRFALMFSAPGKASTVQASVRVHDAGGEADADAQLARMLQHAESTDGITNARPAEVEVAGKTCPSLRLRQEAPGLGTFEVEQVYVERDTLLYVLQMHAPVDEHDGYAEAFATFLNSFTLVELPESEREEAELLALAAKCGSELDWAADWEEASARARAEGKLALVYVRAYQGFAISNETLGGVFMDPDIEPLVRARYVPLNHRVGTGAPFEEQAGYGMSGTTLGEAFLLVDADGSVLRELPGGVPVSAVYDYLVRGLELMPEPPADAPTGPEESPFERAVWLMDRGELVSARELIAQGNSAKAAGLRGALHRRLRSEGADADEALRELVYAIETLEGPARERFRREHVYYLIGLGRESDAVAALEQMIDPGSAARDEARFLLAYIAFANNDKEAAREGWRALITDHDHERWSWLAAAVLTSTGFEESEGGSIAWTREEELASLRSVPADPWLVDRAAVAKTDAILSLLDAQMSDGSWLCPAEAGGERDASRMLTLAVTAIVGEALLPHRAHAEIGPAIERGLAHTLSVWHASQEDPPPQWFMDYTVWSDAYLLRFWADCLAAGVGDEEELRGAMAEVVADLGARQKSGGGWSYYLTADLESEAEPFDISMSFTTAAILDGLADAMEAGVTVPEEVVAGGLDCLESMRLPDGSFVYMVNHASPTPSGMAGDPGAAGRGPSCVMALLRHGRADLDDVRDAIAFFDEYRAGLAKEVGKSLMHCGPYAEGSHYVFFDYMTTATAVAVLPEEERPAARAMILGEILAAHRSDGSFVGNTTIGPAFGTAAALASFDALSGSE